MLLISAKAILVAAAAYFLLLGAIALFQPGKANRFLLGFAASAFKHHAELIARFVVGGAMLVAAPHSAHPMPLTAFGWILIITTAAMAFVPWKTHRKFAEAAVPKALGFLPLIGVTSFLFGALLLWSHFMARAA